MSTWVFDLGNTRLKWARVDPDGLPGETHAIAHGAASDWLRDLPSGDVACVASVADEARRVALLDALSTRFARVHRVHTQPRCGPLQVAYPIPAHLGVDRFLALLDACGRGPALVVGVGTALTIDLLDADGRHRGGRIAPSPELMREALHARASVLPPAGGAYAEFADDTAPALASGCEGAAIALVERSLAQATTVLGVAPALRLHGGGGGMLRRWLPAHDWVPDAVLRGIARWHALAFA
jgi:type III pantothenate kinase